jgi:hypothetical protein
MRKSRKPLRVAQQAGFWCVALAFLTLLPAGCSKAGNDHVAIALPANFSGQVHIEMGVPGAPALERVGTTYQIVVPPDGKVKTSTIIVAAQPRFGNLDAGQVWGYTPTVTKTGDGLSVGGTIEFFVGTKEQYESAEAKKRKSRLYPHVGSQSWDRS